MLEEDVDIRQLFEAANEEALEAYLRLLHPTDIAELFDLVRTERWVEITAKLSPESLAEVLTHLEEHQIETLGEVLNTERLVEAVDELETDDATDVLADLPDDKTAAVLQELEDKDDIETLLAYPEDSAGGIMQTEVCVVEEGKRVSDAIEAVRLAREDVDDVYEVYVVDTVGRLQGTVALEDLVLTDADQPIGPIIAPVETKVTVTVDQEQVAHGVPLTSTFFFNRDNHPTMFRKCWEAWDPIYSKPDLK